MTNWLLGDIGGTNARFATARKSDHGLVLEKEQTFKAADFETIGDATDAYLRPLDFTITHACFGIAAVAEGDEISFTNSPWILRVQETEQRLGVDNLHVVNDFYALAKGVSSMAADDFLAVKEGTGDATAPTLVIGPGTGLGQALIFSDGQRSHVIPTEGGHVAFAPGSEEEIEILKFIARSHARVSVERLLSGQGLMNIHQALCDIHAMPEAELEASDITAAALSKTRPMAERAVDVFCAILGSSVGDAVLSAGARGGVVLGGGILPKILPIFLQSDFLVRLTDKDHRQFYFDDIPVRLIQKGNPALLGAASIIDEAL